MVKGTASNGPWIKRKLSLCFLAGKDAYKAKKKDVPAKPQPPSQALAPLPSGGLAPAPAVAASKPQADGLAGAVCPAQPALLSIAQRAAQAGAQRCWVGWGDRLFWPVHGCVSILIRLVANTG